MQRLHAATWVAPDDETNRGNLLGAVNVVCERQDRDLSEIIEGPAQTDAAVAAARRTGMLILPDFGQVISSLADVAALLRDARQDGWRLLLLDAGVDSAAPSGEMMLEWLARVSAAASLDGPVPPAALRRRVSGSDGDDGFRRTGLIHVECYDAVLAAAGIDLAQVASLLEWGAGPGRMTTHLLARARRAQVTAVDTDAEAIAWVAGNLPVHRADAIAVMPPTVLEDDAFELVVGHSVFTHLRAASQDRWLAELARVTCPGGHVAVSINGPGCLTWHVEHPLVELPQSVIEAFRRDGISIWGGDGWEGEFYEGYNTTFHSHDYVREHWSRWLDVISICDAAALPTQDIVVLRARAS